MSRERTLKSHPNEKPSVVKRLEKAVEHYLQNANPKPENGSPKKYAPKKS